jgi:hypothetical protein
MQNNIKLATIKKGNINNTTYYYTLLKAVGVGFLVSAFVLAVFNVSGAWFFKTAITENTMNIGNINLMATNINNPITYTTTQTSLPISVDNMSNTHIVIRAYFNMYWLEGFALGDVSVILANDDWTLGEDGFFYYNYVLQPSGEAKDTANFLNGIEIFDDTNQRLNTDFIVNIYFEGAQFANFGYANLWLTAPSGWINSVS